MNDQKTDLFSTAIFIVRADFCYFVTIFVLEVTGGVGNHSRFLADEEIVGQSGLTSAAQVL